MQKTVRLMNAEFYERRTCHISSIKDMRRFLTHMESKYKHKHQIYSKQVRVF
jgi:hypothetical protein